MTDRPVPTQSARDESPTSPAQLDAPDWKESLKRAVREFKTDRGTLIAAGMGFYWFLAVFPALIAAVGVIGLLHLSDSLVADIQKAITTTLPGNAATILAGAVRDASGKPRGSSVVATVVGLAVALWSASSGMGGLQAGLNIAYDVPQERKFVKKRLVALALIVATGLLGGVPSPFFGFGNGLIFDILGWTLTV
ncbi:MAG TPA: YihY/virulence factor BrkB family protein, partial [Acidimicrobiales bacterium]|nr:YihY/virulence factor BrkB family protein [Acidimicrobiales bacterium]